MLHCSYPGHFLYSSKHIEDVALAVFMVHGPTPPADSPQDQVSLCVYGVNPLSPDGSKRLVNPTKRLLYIIV